MNINSKQKKVIIIAVAIMVLMALFPPWIEIYSSDTAYSRRMIGYHVIFSAPEPTSSSKRYGVTLDTSRLLVQWFLVALVAGGLIFVFKDR